MGNRRVSLTPEDELAFLLDEAGYDFTRESYLVVGRKWRFDFHVGNPHPDGGGPISLVVEIEGVTWEGGRHQRKQGFEDDCEKYAELVARGYRLLRVTPRQVRRGHAMAYIERIFKKKAENGK